MCRSETSQKPVIYTFDYCHGDFSWTNPRSWHIERYIASVEAALRQDCPGYVYLIDDYAHLFKVFLKYRPEQRPELEKAVREGRIVFSGGGISLERPGWIQAEAYIRNMLDWQAWLEREFGVRPQFFFNADTAGGHSQMPQILSLAGYRYYMFYRPEKILNGKNIPKQFVWQGADGSSVLVNRGYYGMLAYDRAFRRGTPYEDALRAFGEDFSQQAEGNETDLFLIPAGCDDVIPGSGIGDVPCDMPAFMREFEKRGAGKFAYAPPEKFFGVLEKRALPVHCGKLYDFELAYNVPYKSPAMSLYPRRQALAYKLLALERLYAVAELCGVSKDETAVAGLWQELHEISGHAGETAVWDDLQYLLGRADLALLTAQKLYAGALDDLAGAVCSEDEYLVFYPAPRTGCAAEAEITSVYGASPVATEDGRPVQVTETNRPDKKYSSFTYSAVRALFASAAEGIGYETVKFRQGEICPPQPRELSLDMPVTLQAGRLALMLDGRGICSVRSENFCIEGVFGGISARRISLSETWLPDFHFQDDERSRFAGVKILCDGPLCLRFELRGNLCGEPLRQIVTVDKTACRLHFQTVLRADGGPMDYSAVFPLGKGQIRAGIPFGVETRRPETNVTADDYEQNLPGNIYCNGFLSFPAGGTNVVLASAQGHKLMQAEGETMRLLLRHTPGGLQKRTLPTEQWAKNQRHTENTDVYTWSVAFGLDDADAAAFYEETNLPPAVVKNHRRGVRAGNKRFFPVRIENRAAIITAFYKDGEDCVIRLYESAGKASALSLDAPGLSFEPADLTGKVSQGDITGLRPFQIVTLRARQLRPDKG